MPFYCFKCPACGQQEKLHRIMKHSDKPGPECKCGTRTQRDFHAESAKTFTDYPEDWRSTALGVPPSQVAEAQRAAPGVRFDPRTGEVLARNAQERKRAIETIGKPLGIRDLDAYDG